MLFITTKNFILKKLSSDDIESLADIYLKQDYLNAHYLNNISKEKFVEKFEEESRLSERWTVMDKEEKIYGFVSLENKGSKDEENYRLLFFFNEEIHKDNKAEEILQRVIDYGFEALHVHRIFSFCDVADNTYINIFKNLNMTKEASFLKINPYKKDNTIHYRDRVQYVILKENWLKMGQ